MLYIKLLYIYNYIFSSGVESGLGSKVISVKARVEERRRIREDLLGHHSGDQILVTD